MTVPSHCEENPEKLRRCGYCGTPLPDVAAAAPQEMRRTVSILFCDLQGSTSMGERLDGESLREVLTLYFTEMRTCIERHGGTVEKYIGVPSWPCSASPPPTRTTPCGRCGRRRRCATSCTPGTSGARRGGAYASRHE